MSYEPPKEILEKYADVLVSFALGGGEGIKKGEVVLLRVPEVAKPLLAALERAVITAGGTFIESMIADGLDRDFLELASEDQIAEPHLKYWGGMVDQVDHWLRILADVDPDELDGIDPKKILLKTKAQKPMMELRTEKEHRGELTWTVALYGTEGMAKRAELGIEEYWEEIIQACFLDQSDPIARWRETSRSVEAARDRLNALEIERLHVKGEDVDLWVTVGEQRRWEGGGGMNIPSFEIFTSPDWRGIDGWIRFDQPLHYYGPVIEGIELRFEKGEVVEATAKKNEKLLREMVGTDEGSKRVGEFSLTDKRHSRISKFMAETLYDENFGGEWGNTHIALGSAYKDVYAGDPSKLTKEDWERLGFNDSAIHVDIISTTDRTVTATLPDGSERVIYRDGKFVV